MRVPGDAGQDLSRLLEVADRGDEGEQYVTWFLRFAADEAEHLAGSAPALPAAEREAWEGAGARLEDRAARVANQARRDSAYAKLLASSFEGDAAVADHLGVDRSRISQRVAERSLYAFATTGDARWYPRWQFDARRPLRGLKQVLAALDPALHPLVVDHWAQTPSVDLRVGDSEVSPVEWLRTGGSPERVAALVPEA